MSRRLRALRRRCRRCGLDGGRGRSAVSRHVPLAAAAVLQRRHGERDPEGAVYTLDGYDDQCGAAQRAALVGLATPNPDGTIGFGLNIVTVPGGRGVQVDARITMADARRSLDRQRRQQRHVRLRREHGRQSAAGPAASGRWDDHPVDVCPARRRRVPGSRRAQRRRHSGVGCRHADDVAPEQGRFPCGQRDWHPVGRRQRRRRTASRWARTRSPDGGASTALGAYGTTASGGNSTALGG